MLKDKILIYTERVISDHTRNMELVSAIVFMIGSITIFTEDIESLTLCKVFFEPEVKCFPTFLAFSFSAEFPEASAALFALLSIGFFVGSLIGGPKGHLIRAPVALIMGMLWISAGISMLRQYPPILVFPWAFVLWGLFLVWGFKQQYDRRPVDDGQS